MRFTLLDAVSVFLWAKRTMSRRFKHSPSYLNEVNKDEFCSISVCIILCFCSLEKHYYFSLTQCVCVCVCGYVSTILGHGFVFALSFELNYGFCDDDKDIYRWQTNSQRQNLAEWWVPSSTEKKNVSPKWRFFGSSVRSFPLCSYIFSLLSLLLFAFYMLFVLLNYIRLFALLFMHCARAHTLSFSVFSILFAHSPFVFPPFLSFRNATCKRSQ